MAHSLSARKRVRQNEAHRARNRWRLTRVRGNVKEFLQAIQQGQVEQATAKLSGLYKLLDQVAAKGTIHKNAAARYKARLTARLNAVKTAPKAA